MTTTAPSFIAPDPSLDTEPPFDFSSVKPQDVEPKFDAPDPKKSRPQRRPFGRKAPEAPAKKAPGRPPSAKKPVPKAKPGHFVEPLENIYAMVGAVVKAKDPHCGQIILNSATQCAESIDALAQENDMVRRALFALTQTSAIGAVVMAHVPLIMAVTAHHGPGFGAKTQPEETPEN